MQRPRLPIACILLGMAFAAPAALAGQEKPAASAAPATPPTIFSSNRVIVEWAPGANHADRVDARSDAEVEFKGDLGNRSFQLVAVEPGQTASEAVRALEADPAVALAERDGFSAPNALPNDPLLGELWGLQNTGLGIDGFSAAIAAADVNAAEAWARTVGTPSTVIADIDSGYRFNDSELSAVAWTNPGETAGNDSDDDGNGIKDDVHGADFVGPNADAASLPVDGDPSDDNLISGGHGVHTAGTMGAAGNNGVGITGVAQNVRIMALRVCSNSANAGNEARCPFSSQVAAINYAGTKGARVANMSLGGTTSEGAVRDAIAANSGTLYVISAGNDTQNNESVPHYPCNYNPLAEGKSLVDNVICVAATDQADGLASFSDWGATSVDLGAPGTETLSTYPGLEASFHDDFEASNFSATWSKTGTDGFGRAGPGDGPLTSFGMNDSPGETPLPSSVHDVTLTTGVAVPAGAGACRLSGKRYRNVGSGGTAYYQVLSDGSSAFFNSTATATPTFAMTPFNTAPILGLGGHSVKLRFGFTAGSGTTANTGIWFDDLEITCYKPASAPLDYQFLQGTSMAAPHVTGAAGLLFSLEPSATVTEVREALLSGVDAIPSLAGKTTTGGRLDVAKAMDSLEGKAVDNVAPTKPILSSTVPDSGANDNNPRIKGSAEAGTTVTLFKGLACAGAPIEVVTAAELVDPGIAVTVPDNSISFFSASATDAARNKSACSAPISYLEDTSPEPEIVEGPPDEAEEALKKIEKASPPAIVQPPAQPLCTVPKLAGKTLGQAKAALTAAKCQLGKVTQPKARKGHRLPPLVVKSSTPAAGTRLANRKVNLTLGPKPKPKKHHH